MKTALEQAASRGAQVSVRLNGFFNKYNGTPTMHADNVDAVAQLRAAGADVKMVHLSDTDGPPLHLKAAVCDGIAYLDDRNWAGRDETVVRDDNVEDVRAIRKAASYAQPARHSIQLDKATALRSEAALLRSASDRVDVATEEIGFSPVFDALIKIARAGGDARVLISKTSLTGTYRDAVEQLIGAGVTVRVFRANEKFALSNDGRAWIGSANATSLRHDADQVEWGLRTRNSAIIHALQSRFNKNWRSSRTLT